MEEETFDTILPESVLKTISLPESSSVFYTVLKNAIRIAFFSTVELIEELSGKEIFLRTRIGSAEYSRNGVMSRWN